MIGHRRALATVGRPLIAAGCTHSAFAQSAGGILKISFFDNPASMSLHEEATGAALRPMMGVFNNLVMYRQDVAQNSPDSIVPDLATNWAWSEDGKELTFPLRQGVKWHDGKPFTAADVKCTWDLLLGIGSEKLRVRQQQRARNREHAQISFHRPPPVRNAGRKDPPSPPCRPFWALVQGRLARGYHLSPNRNRGSLSTLDRGCCRLAASGYLSSQTSSMRKLLMMLLAIIVQLLTCGCQQ
jgi:hypothetical protein